MTRTYGPHSPATAPTTVTVGYGAREHEEPLHPALVRQRQQVNALACGAHVAPQPRDATLGAITPEEWACFTAALRAAVDADGLVSQTRVRPLIQTIPHKHRGQLYRRARREGLLVEVGREDSTDHAGRNEDKSQRLYRLRDAA